MAWRRPTQLILAATVALGLTLAACGSSQDSANEPSGDSTTQSQASDAGSPSDTAEPDAAASDTAAPGTDAAETDTASSEAGDTDGDTSGDTSAADSGASSASLPAECAPNQLKTKKSGVLTIATDQPVYEPWFVDNKPQNGEGFEGAVAYAVAGELGFSKDQVTWVRAGFDSVVSPAPKKFDFDINEFSITPERQKVVDFSSSYYDVAQAVVTVKGSKIADVTTLAGLQDAKLGAQIGTTSLKVINDVIKPSTKPAVFSQNIDAVTALKNGQIDGIVTDLPTAFYMSSAQIDNGVLLGQIPDSGGNGEQFGLLLEKDSPITTCVSAAVDALRTDGTLQTIADKWLAKAGAPELK